jgi:hypothetical protein
MPKARRSQSSVSHVGEAVYLVVKDPKKRASLDLTRDMAVRFTRAVLTGTTIILVLPAGGDVSDKLRRVVDGIEFYDAADPQSASAATKRALLAARGAPA